MTDAPSFGAAEIAPGEAVTLAVPVNEFAERVRVDVRMEDPDAGIDIPINIPSLDTSGNETVLFTLTDTNVPPGHYLLRTVFLTGPTFSRNSLYAATVPEAPYIPTVIRETVTSADDLAAATEVLTDAELVELLSGPPLPCDQLADFVETMALTLGENTHENDTTTCRNPPDRGSAKHDAATRC